MTILQNRQLVKDLMNKVALDCSRKISDTSALEVGEERIALDIAIATYCGMKLIERAAVFAVGMAGKEGADRIISEVIFEITKIDTKQIFEEVRDIGKVNPGE